MNELANQKIDKRYHGNRFCLSIDPPLPYLKHDIDIYIRPYMVFYPIILKKAVLTTFRSPNKTYDVIGLSLSFNLAPKSCGIYKFF